MADLEALETAKNYKEFFAHAKDIRPSKRDKVWAKMVASMAEVYIDDILSGKSINDESFKEIWSISKWAALRTNEFYAKKRNQLAAKYFEQCLSDKTCHSEQMATFFSDFSKEAQLGIELATIGLKHNLHVWKYVSPMASSSYGEFYCGKTPLYEIVEKQIIANNQFQKEIHKDCLGAFINEAKQKIKTQHGVQFSNAYVVLDKMGELSRKQKTKHLVTQMLSGLQYQPEKWDEAYDALKSLANDLKSRNELLETISKLERVPDGLFSQTKNKKVLVVTKQISKNFPEFLDFYTSQCLDYLSGKKTFTEGNPTPNCHDYFKISKIIDSSPKSVQRKYDQIMNSWKDSSSKL